MIFAQYCRLEALEPFKGLLQASLSFCLPGQPILRLFVFDLFRSIRQGPWSMYYHGLCTTMVYVPLPRGSGQGSQISCLYRPCLYRPCLYRPCLYRPCLYRPCLYRSMAYIGRPTKMALNELSQFKLAQGPPKMTLNELSQFKLALRGEKVLQK